MGHMSPLAPALRAFQDKLWAVYLADTSASILVTSSADGQKWSPYVAIPGQTTITSPALEVFNDRLWVAFLAQNGSNDILLCSSADGKQWSAATTVPNQSSKSYPTLAVYNGKLWLAFVGNKTADLFAYSTVDGKTWVAAPELHQTSCASPSLAVHGTNLWIAFTGDTTHDLLVCSCDGTKWTGNTAVPNQTSSAGPSLAEYDGKLHAGFVAATVGDQLFVCSSPDGKDWGPASVVGNYPTQRVIPWGTPSSTIQFGGGNAMGMDPCQAQFYATLVLNSDGTGSFSGTYTNNGSYPVVTGPAQTYSIAFAIAAGGEAFTFEHSGTAQNANHDSWNVPIKSAQVAAYWPEIVGGAVKCHCVNNTGGLLNAIEGALSSLLGDALQAIEDVGGSSRSSARRWRRAPARGPPQAERTSADRTVLRVREGSAAEPRALAAPSPRRNDVLRPHRPRA